MFELGGDAALDAVLECIPEVSRLVGFGRQSQHSLFLRSDFQTAKPQSIFRQLPLFGTACPLVRHLGSLSVMKMEEK
jgi:hypothetical protein